MNIRELLSDDNAVSPVIGVILMVAITVILAAVIGSFVLNLGGNLSQTSPQASFGFDFENVDGGNDNVTITHETGDSIEADRLNLTATKEVDIATTQANIDPGNTSTSTVFTDSGAFSSGDAVSAGSTLYAGGNGDLNGEDFRVVWTSENEEDSATLSKWTAPNN